MRRLTIKISIQQKLRIPRIIFFLLLYALPLFLQAQDNYTFQIKKLNAEDGLLGQRADFITEDRNGFIWITTLDGLNRFDGYAFKWFNQSNTDLRYGYLQYELPIDEDGYAWLNYEKKVVDCFHTTSFETLTFDERFTDAPFKENEIRKVFSSKVDGSIIIQTWSAKSYQLESGKWTYLPTMDRADILFFDKDEVWYNKDKACFRIDQNGKVKKEFSNDGGLGIKVGGNTNGIAKLCKFDPSTKELTVYNYQDEQRTLVSKTILPLQIKTLNGIHYNAVLDKFILRTTDQVNQNKVFVFDEVTKDMVPIPIDNYISLLHIDRKGILWFNTLTSVVMVKIQPSRFDVYPEVSHSRGIWANEDVVVINSEVSNPDIFDQKIKEKKGSLDHELFASFHGDKNDFWGSNGNSIKQIDLESGEAVRSIPRISSLKGRAWSLLKDKEGVWWSGSEYQQLERFQPSVDDSIQLFNQYNEFDYLKTKLIVHLLEDGEYIWASSIVGLILIHKEDGIVGHYHEKANQPYQLPFTDVHFLYKDSDNVYWAATNYKGLVRFELNEDKEVQNVKQYTSSDNLSSNVLYTIFEDDNDRLWISTLNGISCFNKKTEDVLTFSSEYNLPNNEFNRTSGFQAADGRIYFGSVESAIGFHPDSIIDKKPYEADLLISQVQKYSGDTEQLMDHTASVLESKTIIQEPHERYFTIDVGMTDFYDAKSLQYHYHIEGLHEDFRLMEGNRLQLSGLPYGEYKLHIKGQSADKRFSDDQLSLTLQIIKPFYLRWWFILLAIAALIGGILSIFYIRLARLKLQKEILEKTVAERTLKINEDKIIIEAQSEELKTLDRLKDQFFTNISHELRTPLTLILTPLGTLLKSKNLSNKEFTYTRIIQRHAEYLLKRINEIMELNKLEAKKGEVNSKPLRFYDFTKLAVGTFESIAPQKNITLLFDYQLSKEIQILLDRDKYEHIIYNYLSNAFKYTPENGEVEVIIKEEDNNILLQVRDTGIGISEGALPNVFDRFFQAGNADKSSSSGIGLALCKEVADLLGGTVWAESVLDKGSVFSFAMPYKEVLGVINEGEIPSIPTIVSQPIEVPLPEKTSLSPTSNRLKILLVEDNPDLREFIQLLLSEFYDVVTAKNGKDALDLLTINAELWALKDGQERKISTLHRPPSLILSDIMMPVMDGLELLETIKKSDAYRHIPMVMLTARTNMDAKLTALQLGVDDYITKPFHEDELLIRIHNILQSQTERLSFLQKNNSEASEITESIDTLLKISENDQEWLSELETIVQSNLNNSQFTKLVWAEKMLISERQLRRKVKELTGLTLTKYIQLARLKVARRILEEASKSTVAEVSYAVGFETPTYFSKLFKEEYGRKPVEYFR